MLSGKLVSWLEPICLHLTSERAKERQEALNRLKESILVKSDLKLTSDEACRILKSFFQMVAIEIKYATKTGPMSLIAQNKLQTLFNDSRCLVDSFIQCYPKVKIDEAIDDIFDNLLSICREPNLSFSHQSILSILSIVVSSDEYLFTLVEGHMETLLKACIDERIALDSLTCQTIINRVAIYMHEFDNTPCLKLIASYCSERLCTTTFSAREEDLMTLVAKTFFCVLTSLSKSHPIFVKILPFWEILPDTLSSCINRKHSVIGILVRISSFLFSLFERDTPVVVKSVQLLTSEGYVSRLKLESPRAIQDYDHQESFMLALAEMPLELIPQNRKIKNSVALSGLLFFARSRFKKDISQTLLNSMSEALSSSTVSNMCWILGALCYLDLATVPRSFLHSSIEHITRPELQDLCLAIHRRLDAATIHIPYIANLESKFASSDLNSNLLEAMRYNFKCKYIHLMWSKEAKNRFINLIDWIVRAITDESETRSFVHRIIGLVPELIHLLVFPLSLRLSPSLLEDWSNIITTACENLLSSLEGIPIEHTMSALNSRFSIPRDETFASILLVAPIRLLLFHIKGVEEIGTVKLFWPIILKVRNSTLIHWAWQSQKHLLDLHHTGSMFEWTYSNIISSCIGSFCDGYEDSLDFGRRRSQEKDKLLGIISIVFNVAMMLQKIPNQDAEMLAVVKDCVTFAKEQLNSMNFGLVPSCSIVLDCDQFDSSIAIPFLLDQFRRCKRSTPIDKLLYIANSALVKIPESDAQSQFVGLVYKDFLMPQFDLARISLDARLELVQFLSKSTQQPDFLTTESNLIILSRIPTHWKVDFLIYCISIIILVIGPR